jgi:hypothetical protein
MESSQADSTPPSKSFGRGPIPDQNVANWGLLNYLIEHFIATRAA